MSFIDIILKNGQQIRLPEKDRSDYMTLVDHACGWWFSFMMVGNSLAVKPSEIAAIVYKEFEDD